MIWNKLTGKTKSTVQAVPQQPAPEPWPFDANTHPETTLRRMVQACVRYQNNSGSINPEDPHFSHMLEEIATTQPKRMALRKLWREEVGLPTAKKSNPSSPRTS